MPYRKSKRNTRSYNSLPRKSKSYSGTHNADTRNTASYVYTRENGVFYFAICRKIQFGARKRLEYWRNTGAAGTDAIYCGKWGNFGGGVKNIKKDIFQAAIEEIDKEAGIENFNLLKQSLVKIYEKQICPNIRVYLFYMEHSLFFKLFPKFTTGVRRNSNIVSKSNGEIDAVCSMAYIQLLFMQKRFDKTFFINYFCSTFNEIIKPELMKQSNKFKENWGNYNLLIDNSGPRIPKEFPVRNGEYIEMPNGNYYSNP
jgi:hypothetical protein